MDERLHKPGKPMPVVLTRPFATQPSKPSDFLERLRGWVLPLGIAALLAIGVHAAADTLNERLLWLVDRAVGGLDTVFGAWRVTEPLVNAIGIERRTLLSRGLTLIWELAADAVMAFPALTYRLRGAQASARELFARLRRQPTSARVLRPLETLALGLAGTCAVARFVQGNAYFSLSQGVIREEWAGPFARLLAIAVLFALAGGFVWRAVLRAMRSADTLSESAPSRAQRALAGWVGTGLVLPMALAAAWDALPLFSFFR